METMHGVLMHGDEEVGHDHTRDHEDLNTGTTSQETPPGVNVRFLNHWKNELMLTCWRFSCEKSSV